MAKNKISEWSSTPANNTDVGGIDINEGCAPSGINNAIREVMAQVKDMQAGLDGDNFTVGGNLSVTGTTTLSTALPVASGGTGSTTASAARTALGLGTIATQASDNVSITGGSITGITDLTVADGGTGASSITANSVILGNGASALSGNLVAPGTSGNVLTSNGTTWTSAALNFDKSLSSTGYQKLPGGLIIQWGLLTNNTTTNFSIAFPNAVFSAALGPTGGESVVDNCSIQILTTTQIRFSQFGGGGKQAYYIAIGY